MRKLTTTTWLLAACGWLVGSAGAAEPDAVLNADAVFGPQQNFIRQVSCDAGCADGCCTDSGCDGCGLGSGCSLFGGGCCGDLGDPWTLSSLFGDDPCFVVGGWFQAGYHAKSDGIFNTYPNHFQLHQGYVYVERVADGSNGLGFGGRMDAVYGTDAQNTQAFGNNPGRWDYLNGWDHGVYGWAMPQLYAEVAYHDLSVKVGHFYTLLGYQVVPATGNFFYSIPWTFNFSEAFTHTGALATYNASDNVTLYGGWTLGWDTGFDQFNQGNSFLGGASVSLLDNVTATYILTAGNLGWIGQGYTHSIVVDWLINDKWEYVFQSDLDHTNIDPDPLGTGPGTGYNTIGVNQYLYYTFTERLRGGARFEWWKANGDSVYDFTAGLNVKPHANLLIRPEWRYRWSPALNSAPADNTFNFEQGIFAVDAIVTF
jgi:Putative beta-barrel porin-2, OmpL-like. bbp2